MQLKKSEYIVLKKFLEENFSEEPVQSRQCEINCLKCALATQAMNTGILSYKNILDLKSLNEERWVKIFRSFNINEKATFFSKNSIVKRTSIRKKDFFILMSVLLLPFYSSKKQNEFLTMEAVVFVFQKISLRKTTSYQLRKWIHYYTNLKVKRSLYGNFKIVYRNCAIFLWQFFSVLDKLSECKQINFQSQQLYM